MSLPEQSQLGPYRVVAPLGAGGMGEVYRARDDRLDRDVALKVLPDSMAASPEALLRFQREARAVAALSHPNILAVYDIGEADGRWYLVSELLEGHTLRDELTKSGAMPWRRVAQLGATIAEAVAAAHSKGIVHRDLKPENIFLTKEGRVKILDFGLARVENERRSNEEEIPTTPLVTQPGAVMGTMGYMSPEQVRGETAEASSDIFSVGCVLYELLTGRQPFRRATPAETMAAILRDDPTRPTQPIPAELVAIVDRCLEKEPARRFQSAGDLAFALQSIGTISTVAPAGAAPKTRPLAIAVVAIAVVVLAMAVISLRKPQQATPSQRDTRSTPADKFVTVAVLPLEGAGGESDYLSDGITETLIGRLSALSGMRVSPRSAVFHYKGAHVAARDIAQKLNVSSVITGSTTEDGTRIVLHLTSFDRDASTPGWSHDYSGNANDIQKIEDQAVSDLAALLLRTSKPVTARQATDDPEAYRLYLKGRYYWNKRDKDGLQRAIDFFNQAIDRDPTFAYAYAGLADVYAVLDTGASLPASETFPKAKAAAMKALEIDDSIAAAHTTLAYVKHYYDRDWAGAEAEYRRALALDPNDATAHQWYAEFLTSMGRFAEAKREEDQSVELDPLSPMVSSVRICNLGMARDTATAIADGRKVVASFPDFSPAHAYLGRAYLIAGRYPEAAGEFERAVKLFNLAIIRQWLATAYVHMGEAGKARAIVSELDRSGDYLDPYYTAYPWIALGDKDRAIAELQKAYDTHVEQLVWLKVDPMLDPLRSDARFQELLKRAGFGEE